jgi:HEAT repeat protein
MPETALRDIRSGDPEARLAAIDALSEAPSEIEASARGVLRDALDDPILRVRAAAALALAELGAGDALDRLIELSKSPEIQEAQAAVIALGESGDLRALPAIEAAVASPEADLRFQAVLALGRLAPDQSFEQLSKAAEDTDPEVRANAAAALADTAAERAIPVMRALLMDRDRAVRLEAGLALAELGERSATPTLIEALSDRDVAPQAVRALGQLRDPSAIPALTDLCRSWLARAPLRASAAAALTALDDPFGWSELQVWLGSRRREARAMAIYACGDLRITGAVDRLIEILKDPHHPDRDAAARALGEIGDERARAALDDAASDPDADLAQDARRALEQLATS